MCLERATLATSPFIFLDQPLLPAFFLPSQCTRVVGCSFMRSYENTFLRETRMEDTLFGKAFCVVDTSLVPRPSSKEERMGELLLWILLKARPLKSLCWASVNWRVC